MYQLQKRYEPGTWAWRFCQIYAYCCALSQKQAIKHCLGLSFAYDDMSFKLRPEDCKGSVFKSCKGSSPFYSGASDIIQQFVDKITASETAILVRPNLQD
eukprot:scaffold1535_cov382-Prasinococcus_capsulatus_cf.AAC.19